MGYFVIKKWPKKILSILIFFSGALCWHTRCHDRMSIWWSSDAKTLDFKLMLQICEIDLFAYPTLTKSPAEITLPGCDDDNKWKRYLICLENTNQSPHGGATKMHNSDLGPLTIREDGYCRPKQSLLDKPRGRPKSSSTSRARK